MTESVEAIAAAAHEYQERSEQRRAEGRIRRELRHGTLAGMVLLCALLGWVLWAVGVLHV